jgi:hypothetical protein
MGSMSVDVAILTVIPAELDAARAALGIDDRARDKDDDGTVYFHGAARSDIASRDYRVVVSSPSRIAGQYRLNLGTALLMTGLRQRWRIQERARLAGTPPYVCLLPLAGGPPRVFRHPDGLPLERGRRR